MNRYSYPSIPADRTHQSCSSRPLSLVLGPSPQPHEDGAGDISLGGVPNARVREKSEDDKRPMTEIGLGAPSEPDKGDAGKEYPESWKLVIITVALCMAIFLVALDTTIVAAAIPRITDDFKVLDDVGWYGSAYLLTICSFQLAFGKCYAVYSIKAVFLTAIGIFEFGSLICGTAPTSRALIVGRAIAGMGCAGIFSGTLIVIAYSVPLHQRPIFTGLIGAMYGVASVTGPLLGGVFTDQLSWRWCFYINLPIGAVTAIIIAIFFKAPSRAVNTLSFRQKLDELDFLGTLVFLPSIVCLLLGLQWGGTRYPWSSGRVIALLILAALFAAAFVAIQIWKQDKATVPPRIICQRSIAFGAWYSFVLGGAYFILIYYLPIWFQAIKAVSATRSGVMNIPLIMAHVIAALLAGILITSIGYYTPFMLISAVLVSTGTGMLTTWHPNTGHATWIGYQICFGLGSGLGMNQPLMAAQTVLPLDDVSIGTASSIFAQTLGGAVFISAAENIFENRLLQGLRAVVPQLDPKLVLATGATDLRSVVRPEHIGPVIEVYNDSLVRAFQLATALACLTAVGALGMEWRSVKRGKGEQQV